MSDENPTPADDAPANEGDDPRSSPPGTAGDEEAGPTDEPDGDDGRTEADDERIETDGESANDDAGGLETGTDDESVDAANDPDAENAADGSADSESSDAAESDGDDDPADAPPSDVQKYARFKKMDGAEYDRVNEFLRDRTYVTAREWAIARLCADFRTETGVEMTKIGNNLPQLVPFMTDTYTPQAVNQARSSFEDKVRKSGATFLYGAMSGFFTAEELDELMYEVSEIAKFLLEVEGVDLSVEDELEAEERISSVMREVREASEEFREEELADDAADD
ncbi:hypothetical protein SAMN05216278_0079 [Halopelagius longus]|uniref:Uncharacterized protein n=1 Tax=Halopelagius longus TaxID=1236180 RepID=A0A1H0XQ08_9EURY|nr:DUF5806 family protein [Halopelagius longus]SDQ04889.1 hypothetical protein SAMN05216278_0079 [Halopelagius longus]